MRSLTTFLILAAHPFALGVAAHKDWWLQGLPSCWQDCFSNTGSGCKTSNCICSTSSDNTSYLPDAVSCAVSKCKAVEWSLDIVLGPLGLYCAAVQSPIPAQVMKDAYTAAGSDGDNNTPASPPAANPPTPLAPSIKSSASPQTTQRSSDIQALTSTIRSTFTRTTTEDGNTLQVVVPIVIGPSGMYTGVASTSTITDSVGPSSSVASSATPSQSPSVVAPSVTPVQSASATSTHEAQSSRKPASGNGSPFDNMQASGTRWSVSAPLLSFVIITAFFVRL